LPQSNATLFGRSDWLRLSTVSALLLKQRDNSQEQRAKTADGHRCHYREAMVSAVNAGLLAVC
jgi:hypothetical protein